MKLFECFFWIEPKRVPTEQDLKPKVLWYYPKNVSAITKEFKDIPQFCFPDLEILRLEKAQTARNEHFTFTLTDKYGRRYYGICMRALFRGMKRRHDVGRRYKHCLCFITTNPFFALFKTVLLELHAIALLHDQLSCRSFLEHISNLFSMDDGREYYTIPCSALPGILHRNLTFIAPKPGFGLNQILLLPLFDVLGIERFFKLFSAVLCERKIVFIADNVGTLSTTILG